VLAGGKRALVLVPEVGLTAQAVRSYEARFPGRVAVLHGRLSQGQRYDVWDNVRRGQVDVLVGSRSALFAPMSQLGLIVVDEAHDPSYKQEEPIPLPAYHACDVAIELGRLSGAGVVLGTATPDIERAYLARKGTYRSLALPHPVVPSCRGAGPVEAAALAPVHVVDLRQELRAGNRSIFSRALQRALGQTLEGNRQAILFLNRRGAATFVLCRDCGHVEVCPECRIPLSYHAARPQSARDRRDTQDTELRSLLCHRCNRRQPMPALCSRCGGGHIRYFGLGTERVEAELRALFPQARLLRWDRDTATGPGHERFLQGFADHNADVLVGTQMIAKGLDLPLVSLVGVISADTSLNLPDLRAGERTFQLLTQVAGRAGYGPGGGQVIFQTYHPEHYAIRSAAQHDYSAFYEHELALRRELGYPPFSRLLALRYLDPDAGQCQAEAMRLARWLGREIASLGLSIDLMGPAPCFYSRVRDRYRWQIVLRGSDPASFLCDVVLPSGWRVDVDPLSLL
jgi:primosomal protein N' (replication factor Y)